jgi:hypothetical protein
MKRFDDILETIGLTTALVGWVWMLGIVIDQRTPGYIRVAGALLVFGSAIVYYYSNVKDK